MWKLTSWAFRKCGSFWDLEVLNQSYWLSKLGQIQRKILLGRRRHKKRHCHNINFWSLKRIAGRPHHVRRPGYSFQAPKIEIVAVSFFCDASFPAKFFSEFDPTLTAKSYGLKTPNLKNYHTFGKLRTSAFTQYPLYRSYLLKNLSNLRFCFSSFAVFWRFQLRAPDVALLNHWSWPFEPFHRIFCMNSYCLW